MIVKLVFIKGHSYEEKTNECNIYNALVSQVELDSEIYLISAGKWYYVEKTFYDRVSKSVDNIPIADLELPVCPENYNEGDYNTMIAKSSDDFCLMDKKTVSVEGGQKKIEACDIFTKSNQFIHVKNRGKSSQLSHLFAQGRVSAECFMDDEVFRKQVSAIAETKFGEPSFDYHNKPSSDNQFEIVYAIIAPHKTASVMMLPFFSKVNLMNTVNALSRMHYKYSICFIEKQ